MPAPLAPTTDRTVRQELALLGSQKDALRLLADATGRSVNDLIREAIEEWLTQEDRR